MPIPRLLNNALPWTGVRLLRNSSSNMVIAGLPAASMTAESNTVCLLLLVCQMETPVSPRKGSSMLQGPQYCVELQDHRAWPYHESGSERYERDCQLTLPDSLDGQMVNISTSDVERLWFKSVKALFGSTHLWLCIYRSSVVALTANSLRRVSAMKAAVNYRFSWPL